MNHPLHTTRRHFFGQSTNALGAAALCSLQAPGMTGGQEAPSGAPHFAPRAKRVIYLFQAGAPSQIDLFDHKPRLRAEHGQQLPDHVRGGQRLTGMSAQQASIPMAGSAFDFARYGQSGASISELLPHTAGIADKLCIVRSMFTEAINHDPAVTFLQTGSQIAGRPCMGAWASYGIGTENKDLPAFVVLVSAGQGGQPLYSRLWGNGFLDGRHQGVPFRPGVEPVLFLANPDGITAAARRRSLDTIAALDGAASRRELDPAIDARLAQYELAFRMQTSVPEATSLEGEPESTFDLYGEDARKPGTFAANCLLARRMAERGVRFIQLYHQGWDHHSNLPQGIRAQAQETDRASAALVRDLEQRGLLDDTLVVWGGEFGRTAYCQGKMSNGNYGRDHHPRCFSIWMAGAGVRAGTTYGQTDDYGYNIVDADGQVLHPSKHHSTPGAVHVHDLQATILHLMGLDHERLTFRTQGRDFRLTDVHGRVVRELLA